MRANSILLSFVLTACGGTASETSAVTASLGPIASASAGQPAATAAPQSAKTTAGDSDRGKAVYETYCQACHQADGTGMNGMLGANFVADKTRLAKSDADLMKSISEGVTGSIGTMPPWAPTLTEQERKDALAYIRKQYGGK